jgi:lipopolysaccharide export system protein LptC
MKLIKLLKTALLPFAIAGLCFSQMIPDAPIENFRLPMFGEDGYKSWELRGLRGHYLDETSAIIEGMELVTFDGGAELLVGNKIRSPKALISFKDSTASGESSLFVTGMNFAIQGQDWEWNGKENSITVKSQVRVTFNQQLDLLK